MHTELIVCGKVTGRVCEVSTVLKEVTLLVTVVVQTDGEDVWVVIGTVSVSVVRMVDTLV